MNVDLVLVHGFWSSPSTWDRVIARLAGDPDLSGLRIHAFPYESPRFRWPMSPARIPDYNDIAQSLPAYLATQAAGNAPIIIVTHSQGGLILQRFIAWMLTEGRGRELARVRLAILFSCPNEGSEYLRTIRAVVGFRHHPQAGQLDVLEREVREARRTVLRQAINAESANEWNCRIPIFVYSGRTDNIVRRESAQSIFPNAEVLPGDHFSILDPDAPGHLTVPTIKRHVLDLSRRMNKLEAAKPTASVIAESASYGFSGVRDDTLPDNPSEAARSVADEANEQSNFSEPTRPMVSIRQGDSAVPSLGAMLHRAADVFDRFIVAYPGGAQLSRSVAIENSALLQARIVDLRPALATLADKELSAWPDEEFVVMIRTPRNRAMEQVIELRNLLAHDANADAELRRLVASLEQIRQLVRERVPM